MASPLKRSTRAMGGGGSASGSGSGIASPVKAARQHQQQQRRPETPGRRDSYIKKQAMFCDVVVEGSESGGNPRALASFVQGLGDRLRPPTASPAFPITPSKSALEMSTPSKRPPNLEKLRCVLQELLTTESNYVARLHTLLESYALPLRAFAQRRGEEVIPAFEARQIFGNIEAILPANQSFLKDLEASLTGSRREHWASAVLRHLTFFASIYPAYIGNLENARKLEQGMRKRSPAFCAFLDKTREILIDSPDHSNLQSLLIEPMQRIPRYRLILMTAIKEIEFDDPAREDILVAMEVAGRIASLDEDEKTRRAAALWGLNRSIENMPAVLTNSNRYFVDCIDVFDTPLSRESAGTAPGTGYQQHTQDLLCTLFLFNDYLVIAKRKVIDKTGRQLVGLDNVNELTKEMLSMQRSRSGLASPFKSKSKSMEYCGKVDLGELVVGDGGLHDFKLFLEKPPTGLPDKFNSRPLRHFIIVKPETESDKSRFLQNIWRSTSYLKAQEERSTARHQRQDSKSIYFNLYNRRTYYSESRKAKMALQITDDETIQDLSFGPTGPHAIFRAVVVDETACSYTVTVRGDSTCSAPRVVTTSELVRHIIGQARNLRLYDVPPRIPGRDVPLDRQTSMASTRSRALSASSSRPRSVMDFVGSMLSPGATEGSPRRTLSKASKTSSIDSRAAASIFSGEYASTAQTSIRSPSPYEEAKHSPANQVHASAPARTNGSQRERANSIHRPASQPKAAEKSLYASHESSSSSAQLANAASLMPDEEAYSKTAMADDDQNEEDAVEIIDSRSLSRSASSQYLRKAASRSSLHRSRSMTLSRSTSTQSLRIDEEDEEEEEEAGEQQEQEAFSRQTPSRITSPAPDGLLSPRTLQRHGTLSRPFGPRQLGSRSPQSPQPPHNPVPSGHATPSRTESDPFLAAFDPNSSLSKKRKSDEGDAGSVSSKRALRDIFEPNASSLPSSRAETPSGHKSGVERRPDSVSRRQDSVPSRTKSRIAGPRDLAHKELSRNSSLPRSPHTRRLYQQSQIDPPSNASETSLPRSSSSLGRIARKPVPKMEDPAEAESTADVDDMRMEIDLVRRQSRAERDQHEKESVALKEENGSLRRALEASQSNVKALEAKLDDLEASKEREFDELVQHITRMADEKIEEHAAILEAKVKALEAQLRNQRRAFEVQLKNRS